MDTNLSIVPDNLRQPGDGLSLLPRSILQMTQEQAQRLMMLAQLLSKSQLAIAKNNKTPLMEGDIFIIFMKGLSLGMTEMQALESIDLIAGKPTLDPQGMLGLINAKGMLEDIKIAVTDQYAEVTMKRKGFPTSHTERFDMDAARRMKSTEWENGQKKTISLCDKTNWQQQPGTMMKWRAVAACARVVFPDVIQGLYTPEELGATVVVDDAGRMEIVGEQPVENVAPSGEMMAEDFANAPIDLTGKTNQEWLARLLKEVGHHSGENSYYLAQIEPGKVLAKFSETTLTKAALETRVRAIGHEYATAWTQVQEAGFKPYRFEELATIGITASSTPQQILAAVDSFRNGQPATPKGAGKTAAKASDQPAFVKWADPDFFDMLEHAVQAYDLAAHTALAVCGVQDWQEFPDLRTAKDKLREAVYRDSIAVKAYGVEYVKEVRTVDGKKRTSTYALFNSIIPVRLYGRDKLRALGEDWATYAETWETGETYVFADDDLPPLIIEYVKKDGYNEAAAIRVADIKF